MRTVAFICISLLGASACGGSAPAPPSASPSASQSSAGATGSAPDPAPADASTTAVNASPAVASDPGAAARATATPETTQAATPGGTQTTAGGSLAPAVASPTAAPGTMSVTTKAVELKVEGVTTAPQLGSRQARSGYEFVIVDTSWKNLIPLTAVDKTASSSPVGGLGGFSTSKRPPPDPKNITMMPTAYVVPMLRKHVWLMTDGRFADAADAEAQGAVPGALPADGFAIAKLDDVVRGKFVFEAPAGTHYRAFQFYDNTYGHALIPLGGTMPAGPAPTIGRPRQNQVMQLTVTEAGFSQTGTPPAGLKYYGVGLRGISRSPKDIVELQFGEFVFLQNDEGCVSQPERGADAAGGLSRPFGDTASFPPTSPNEGQLLFLVPDNTKQTRLLVAPRTGGSITLPTGSDFTPSWPAPQTTIEDGSVMKVHILPTPGKPAILPDAPAGREFVMLDVVVENANASQGIEFQGTMQLRLMDPSGAFIQPSPELSGQLPCRIGDTGVIPAGGSRRFMYVYDVPAGMPRKLQYRGFEKEQVVVDIKR